MKPVVWILGPGRVGRALACCLVSHGAEVTLLGRSPGAWQEEMEALGVSTRVGLPAAGSKVDQLWIAVGDADLAEAVRACVEADLQAELVLHTSGVSGLELLAPLAAGHRGIVHPLLAFSGRPSQDRDALKQANLTFTAAEESQAVVQQAAQVLGGRLWPLPGEACRARYHLALTLASNHLAGLMGWAESLLAEAMPGAGRELLSDLAQQAIANCRRLGPQQALTGPVVRGDLATLQAHLSALSPADAQRYRASLQNVLELARASGRLGEEAESALLALLEDSSA